MNITAKFLRKYKASFGETEWFHVNNCEGMHIRELVNKLVEAKLWHWANWLLSVALSNENKILYAINAAKLALPVFEKAYPNDSRPRKAIESARDHLDGKINDEELWELAKTAGWAVTGNPLGAADYASAAARETATAPFHLGGVRVAAWCAVEADKTLEQEILEFGLNLIEKED